MTTDAALPTGTPVILPTGRSGTITGRTADAYGHCYIVRLHEGDVTLVRGQHLTPVAERSPK